MISLRKPGIFLVNTLLILILVIPAQAESPIEKAKKVKSQISSMSDDLHEAFESYKENEAKLRKLNKQVAKNTVTLQNSIIELKKNQRILSKRISIIYRSGDVSMFDVLLAARSFNEMLVNLNFIMRIGKKDSAIINKVAKLKAQSEIAQKRLITDQAIQKKTVYKLKKKKNYIDNKLDKAKNMLSGLQKEIAELSKPKPLPAPVRDQISPPSAAPIKFSGTYAFPAGSPHSFSNDWGAPRRGHRHQGNDILAPMGTPAFAVISGTVSSSNGRSSGLWITLRGDDGNNYWYMHMQNITASGRVSTGQQIGTIGNTGNASGGPAHIHFELHPGGGGPVNPYYFLSSTQ